jgi:hypothetical protein
MLRYPLHGAVGAGWEPRALKERRCKKMVPLHEVSSMNQASFINPSNSGMWETEVVERAVGEVVSTSPAAGT